MPPASDTPLGLRHKIRQRSPAMLSGIDSCRTSKNQIENFAKPCCGLLAHIRTSQRNEALSPYSTQAQPGHSPHSNCEEARMEYE
jgi:hypothetical protein